jgi:hypothetical protein
MACRTLLLKLHRRGHIELPPPQRPANNGLRNARVREVGHRRDPIRCDLQELLPLRIDLVKPGDEAVGLFNYLLQKYHYLGHRNTVGEALRYLVRCVDGRALSCVLFGSAAWAVRARDEYIGWDGEQRLRRLSWITNNTRLLLLPWVRVKNLASHVLGSVCSRVRADWMERYGHPVSVLESFVDRSRFSGTCYRAANWRKVGTTSGRTRNGTRQDPLSTLKDVYVFGLVAGFRAELCGLDRAVRPLVRGAGR